MRGVEIVETFLPRRMVYSYTYSMKNVQYCFPLLGLQVFFFSTLFHFLFYLGIIFISTYLYLKKKLKSCGLVYKLDYYSLSFYFTNRSNFKIKISML